MTAAEEAAAAFDVAGAIVSVEPHPTGHINDAYLVTTDRRRYLLQRLNPFVFPDAEAVMANVVAVTDHLHSKGEPTLSLVARRSPIDAIWRMYEYIEASVPLAVRSADDAAVVGRAFGRFHRLCIDLDPATMRVSLPGFHDPGRRRRQLEDAIETDRFDRVREASDVIDALRAIEVEPSFDRLPVRVAHNDAKAANLLVGEDAVVVIDLDTVMPGSILWDVGDMVRSTTGTADEANAVVSFDAERYDALVGAWLTEVGGILTDGERSAIPKAGPTVTFEQAMRFLTDHLDGDVYFRVTGPGQNLERARNQLDLLRSMISAL